MKKTLHNKEKSFVLLKRTYPISQIDRYCDGYKFIIDNTTVDDRKIWNIDLPIIIKKGEKYIYEVGKLDDKFKTKYISIKNFKIIRNYILKLNE